MDKRENTVHLNILLAKKENCFLLCHEDFKISCMYKHRFLIHCISLKFLYKFQKLSEIYLYLKCPYLRGTSPY